MKKEDHNPNESVEKQHYKKKYLVRKIEEAEAEKEAKDYSPEEQEIYQERPDA